MQDIRGAKSGEMCELLHTRWDIILHLRLEAGDGGTPVVSGGSEEVVGEVGMRSGGSSLTKAHVECDTESAAHF